MRFLLSALFAVASLASIASSESRTRWTVTASRVLEWDGKPYIPVGWRLTSDQLDQAKATGVKDVIIDLELDSDWRPAVAKAEGAHMRYLLSLSTDAPGSPAFIVRPEAYRIDSVKRDSEHTIPVPNGRSVFYLLLTTPDYSIASKGWSDVIDGQAKITVSSSTGTAFVLLLYPRVTASRLTDYWERFDLRRDAVLAKLIGAKVGGGIRGVVNPLGKVDLWTSQGGGYVPDSPAFRMEFESYLRAKYKDVASLERSWKLLRPNLKDFRGAARFVPLFGTSRGVDSFYDPQENVLAMASRHENPYWKDIQAVIDNAAARRTERLGRSISEIVDAPVVYEWNGWSPIYDTRQPSGNGIGMTAVGAGLEAIENYAAKAASSALAWKGPRWLLVTEMSPGSSPYTEERLRTVVSDTADLGAKGWFIRWSGGSEAPWMMAMAAEAAASDIATRSPVAMFYPENARFPATTMKLPGGVWWLPTPAGGNRLEVGPDYEAYRHDAPYGDFMSIWRRGDPRTVKLRFSDNANVVVKRHDGQPLETKLVKGGIELTLDNLPVIIEGTDDIPVPQDSADTTRADFKALIEEGRRQGLQVGNTQFMFDDAYRSFERNPGAAYLKMVEAQRELEAKLAPFLWVEGESSSQANFSEVVHDSTASAERALSLDTPLAPGPDGYFAKYKFRVRHDQIVMDIWIAADVPPAGRPYVAVDVNGTALTFPMDAQSGYGRGFGWYNLGKMSLRDGEYTLTIRILQSSPEFKVSVDALLMTPLAFRPAGPRIPRYVPGF
ncbi:MAG: hypothetical protein ACR2HJ_08060 [Fimbriimonadales bacterium]